MAIPRITHVQNGLTVCFAFLADAFELDLTRRADSLEGWGRR